MSIQIMIDIETLSTQPNAAIATIGAVAFTFESGVIKEKDLYQRIDITDSIKHGHVCGETLQWLLKQPDEVRIEFTRGGFSLEQHIRNFCGWVDQFENKNINVWANSPSFDLVILKQFMKSVPWNFWNERDYRTYIKTAESLGFTREYTSKDVAHNALEDARNQANQLIKAHRYLHDLKSKADDRDLITLGSQYTENCQVTIEQIVKGSKPSQRLRNL